MQKVTQHAPRVTGSQILQVLLGLVPGAEGERLHQLERIPSRFSGIIFLKLFLEYNTHTDTHTNAHIICVELDTVLEIGHAREFLHLVLYTAQLF